MHKERRRRAKKGKRGVAFFYKNEKIGGTVLHRTVRAVVVVLSVPVRTYEISRKRTFDFSSFLCLMMMMIINHESLMKF